MIIPKNIPTRACSSWTVPTEAHFDICARGTGVNGLYLDMDSWGLLDNTDIEDVAQCKVHIMETAYVNFAGTIPSFLISESPLMPFLRLAYRMVLLQNMFKAFAPATILL